MTVLSDRQDAFGALLADQADGLDAQEVIERDDGYIGVGSMSYLAPVRTWPSAERRALRLARGRVLDVGCGAGRVALELQRRGHPVTGIDVSPGAVELARRRGMADARLMSLGDVRASDGPFQTVVMFGNNFGLFETPRRLPVLARRLARACAPDARILATSSNPSSDKPENAGYHRRNRERGRLPGQLRLRVRYRLQATPWFDYLIVSPEEMAELLRPTPWRIARLIGEEAQFYVAVLERA